MRSYARDGDEVNDLDSDDEEAIFDVSEGDSVHAKHSADDGAPGVAPSPDASVHGMQNKTASAKDLNDFELEKTVEQLLPEEEPELIGTAKAPKISLSHDAPLHANSQSLFKSLRG